VAGNMGERVAASGGTTADEISDGLVEAVAVQGAAAARDRFTSDRLVTIETSDGAPIMLRLDRETTGMLLHALCDEEDAAEPEAPTAPHE
jgi:hypothetical protein